MADDDDDNIIPVPAAPRRPGRPAKVQLYPRDQSPPEPELSPFDGMTSANCASACSVEKGCVITGENFCAHPHKGGLQAKHQMMNQVRITFEQARDYLRHQAIDKRKGA